MSAIEVRDRLAHLVNVVGARLRVAPETWDTLAAADLRVRLGGSFVGGLVLAKVVRGVVR